ncbi:MFS general substrate transporter [Xylona heveae TC161]|uniref:MFS general substrate transporter n=1 Tax=Xylona heveae (strain CBS 132557 / TC161) TaxID=1328760 RepID=A0A165GRY2_XYLHT|nr:MFS general substrate transporter [Xylona heveae TC161]KZF22519.1 MFS general substrate transporter [Xylona heveae TC161]
MSADWSERSRASSDHAEKADDVHEPVGEDGGSELGPRRSRQSLTHARSYGSDYYGCSTPADVEDPNAEPESPEAAEKEFEVQWDGDQDPLNPRSFQTGRKWIITIICSLASFCVTCVSSIYSTTYDQITKEFHVSREVATLGLSMFVVGLGLGPMWLGPLSEFYGRRPIYWVSFTLFFIWLIPCAVAKNIQTMIIARFFNGFAGSAFLSVVGGTVGDMFTRDKLGAPMMIFTASPFLGPVGGPLIGGFINQFTTWRWSFWVTLIWSGVMLGLIILMVPETYHPVLLREKARRLRKETGNEQWIAPMERTKKSITRTLTWSVLRPFELLFFEPMCLNLCLLSAILLGILYLFFGAFPLVFVNNHGFKLWQVGLTFLGLFVGMVAGISCDPLFRRNYQRLVREREEQGGEPGGSEPEFRLPPAIVGAILVPIGLFWFGWTSFSHVHWILPIIGSGIFGMGMVLCFSGVFTFLVDAYPLYAASALAANSFARSSFAAAFPLFGVQMYERLGYQWATSLLAFLSVAMAPFPYLFFRYGKRIRGKSRFAAGRNA